MLKKIFRFFLVLLALLVLLAIGWFCQVFLSWPVGSMWLWPIVPLISWLVFSFVRRQYVAYKAKQRLKTKLIADQKVSPDQDWVDGVRTFLAAVTDGDPLALAKHRLHFVLGLTGSGKTTLLKNAGSDPSLGDVELSQTVSPTSSCSLGFLEAGIAVEISGRHVDPKRDVVERDNVWDRLLSSIKVDVTAEQCASIVVCVSALDLKVQQSPTNVAGWQLLRRRISDLMALAKRRLPVYVLLTHVDQLEGGGQLIEHLPVSLLSQPAGVLLPVRTHGANHSGRDAITEVTRYLPYLAMRASALGQPAGPAGLLASRDLRLLQPNFEVVIDTLFGLSSYREAPIYRGLFLSGKSGEGAESNSLRVNRPILAFARGLFNTVLAKDQAFLPLLSYEKERRRRLKLAWLAFYTFLGLSVCWLIGGFMNQSHNLIETTTFNIQKLKKSDSVTHHIKVLVASKPQVDWLIDQNSDPWSFFLPFSGSLLPINNFLKHNFVTNYDSYIHNYFDPRFWGLLDIKSAAHDDALFVANGLDYLVYRLTVIEDALKGRSLEQLYSVVGSSAAAIQTLTPEATLVETTILSRLMIYAIFVTDRSVLLERIDTFKQVMGQLAKIDHSLNWLLTWANQLPNISDVRLNDFWQPSSSPSELHVKAAFTLKGYQAIEDFLDRLMSVDVLRDLYSPKRAAFMKLYELKREIAWKNFVLQFNRGQDLLVTQQLWVDVLTSFNSPQSPYRELESLLLSEFPDGGPLQRPTWVSTLGLLGSIRTSAESNSLLGGLTGKLAVIESSVPLVATKSTGNAKTTRGQDEKNLLNANKIYATYSDAMGKALSDVVVSPGKAAGVAIDYSSVGRNPAVKDSSLRNAYNALQRLENSISTSAQPFNEPAWVLLRGELTTTTDYVYRTATCTMQNDWVSTVLGPNKLASSEADAYTKLLGDQGTLWAYLKTSAQPFLSESSTGYTPVVTNNSSLPWDPRFLAFVNNAAKQKRDRDAAAKKAELSQKLTESRNAARIKDIDAQVQQIDQDQAKFNQTTFTVDMAALPVGANQNAAVQPYGLTMTLNCAKAPQRLTQLNYSTSQAFTWTSGQCGDAELRILIENQTLSKKWTGTNGFDAFLRAFDSGRLTLTPTDFPPQEDILKQLGITEIDVVFQFTGSSTLTSAVKKSEAQAVERTNLVAEKASLEQAQTAAQQDKLNTEISSLASTGPKAVTPETVATCTF
jgi:type VI secretion system protein ImpL